MTSADAIARLVGSVLPVRTELSGGLAGWWRMSQDGVLVPSTTPVSQLAADRPVVIQLVPNQLERVELRVAASDPPARFLTVVGTAVPVVSLVDHLCGWLGLPAGRWELAVDGRVLGAQEILADHEAPPAGRVLDLRAASA